MSSTTVAEYLRSLGQVIEQIQTSQAEALEQAAQLCAQAIARDGLVHTFGSGHSRIVVEEIWPRYGSFPGFHPIVELSVTSYHQVAGANAMRQAMFLENVPGFAAQILRNFAIGAADVLIAVSSGGTSVVTVECAEQMRALGRPVVAITALEHSRRSAAKAPSGNRLFEVADIVLDTCTPVGDAAVTLPGLVGPVGPTTTVAGAAIANALKVRTAELLLASGVVPSVLPSAVLVGAETSANAFEDAYREHARRVSRLYVQ